MPKTCLQYRRSVHYRFCLRHPNYIEERPHQVWFEISRIGPPVRYLPPLVEIRAAISGKFELLFGTLVRIAIWEKLFLILPRSCVRVEEVRQVTFLSSRKVHKFWVEI
jgi:hypothetical protein